MAHAEDRRPIVGGGVREKKAGERTNAVIRQGEGGRGGSGGGTGRSWREREERNAGSGGLEARWRREGGGRIDVIDTRFGAASEGGSGRREGKFRPRGEGKETEGTCS